MFILGQSLSAFKRVYYALQKFSGIGLPTAIKICNQANIHPQCHINELNENHLDKLKPILQEYLEKQRHKKIENARKQLTKVKPVLPQKKK